MPSVCHYLLSLLQLVQNIAAWILVRRDHIPPIMVTLHWLPLNFRVNFRTLLLKLLTIGHRHTPLSFFLYTPTLQRFRSADQLLLKILRSKTKLRGE